MEETRELTEFQERFEKAYRQAAPFSSDRDLGRELALEARPVLISLLEAAGNPLNPSPNAPAYAEAHALVSLLGRRCAVLGATPIAAMALVPAVTEALSPRVALPKVLTDVLTGLCAEGYTSGRDDLLAERLRSQLVGAQAIFSPWPSIAALVLAGDLASELVSEVGERFGRYLLRQGAEGCIVDLSQLESPSSSAAVEVFGIDATARMLGVECVFSGVTEEWAEALGSVRLEEDLIASKQDFAEALRHLIRAREKRNPSWLPKAVRGLLKNER